MTTPEKAALHLKYIQHEAEQLVRVAKAYGIVVTMTQKPLEPLAMGNYETVVEVREARK